METVVIEVVMKPITMMDLAAVECRGDTVGDTVEGYEVVLRMSGDRTDSDE